MFFYRDRCENVSGIQLADKLVCLTLNASGSSFHLLFMTARVLGREYRQTALMWLQHIVYWVLMINVK